MNAWEKAPRYREAGFSFDPVSGDSRTMKTVHSEERSGIFWKRWKELGKDSDSEVRSYELARGWGVSPLHRTSVCSIQNKLGG